MPGFFGDQADRLLRKNWTDPFELAQELWAMFNADLPMTTDQPVIITRNSNSVPATKIIDNTDGSSSPIIINKTDSKNSDQPNADSGGNYSCCGSPGQNSQPKQNKEPSKEPFPSGGNVGPATPPSPEPPKDPNTPYKQFLGSVTIKINQGSPDIFGWNGEEVPFVAIGCFPYKPPTVPAPTDPFDITFHQPSGTIQGQIDAFMSRWGLDGYDIIDESVGPPGATC